MTWLPSKLRLDAVRPYRIPTFERAGMLRLDVNEHPGGAPAFVIEALRAELTEATVATYPVYADWHREAAAYFGVQPDELTCTAGGDEAIKALCEAFLLPGTSLVTMAPGYDMFTIWAQLYGNPLVGVPLAEGFAFDAQAWREAVRQPDVGLVALITPNNPTGTLVDRQAILDTLLAVRCPVVVDETYAEFVGQSIAERIADHPHLFVIRSFSKVHGLAGLRAGAVLSQAQNIEALRRVLNPFNVSRPAVTAARAVMRHPEETAAHVARITAARSRFVQDLHELGIETGPATANFVLARLGSRAGEVTAALQREGILVRDRTGSHPRLDGWLRIAIGTPPQMLRCAGALRKCLAEPPKVQALLLDFDGPMVDVAHSYRTAIVATARHLLNEAGAPPSLGAEVTLDRVEALKRRGGLNNDWDCTATLLQELGFAQPYDRVVQVFQDLYWQDGRGLIAGEPFLVGPELQARIANRFATAIVTGRPRAEALWTLQRHGADSVWPQARVVAMEDMPRQKPAPDGLLRALADLGASPERSCYVGDGVDDMRAAKAAGMLAIGVLPAQGDWGDGLCERLYEAGAQVVFRTLDEVVTWLSSAPSR